MSTRVITTEDHRGLSECLHPASNAHLYCSLPMSGVSYRIVIKKKCVNSKN